MVKNFLLGILYFIRKYILIDIFMTGDVFDGTLPSHPSKVMIGLLRRNV